MATEESCLVAATGQQCTRQHTRFGRIWPLFFFRCVLNVLVVFDWKQRRVYPTIGWSPKIYGMETSQKLPVFNHDHSHAPQAGFYDSTVGRGGAHGISATGVVKVRSSLRSPLMLGSLNCFACKASAIAGRASSVEPALQATAIPLVLRTVQTVVESFLLKEFWCMCYPQYIVFSAIMLSGSRNPRGF